MQSGHSSTSPPLRFSVIVPYYDQRFSAAVALESWCLNQRYPSGNYEVLLVAAESQAIDEHAVEALGAVGRVVRIEGSECAELYHSGALSSEGNFLLFTEIHCIADPDCLENLDAFLRNYMFPGACIGSYGDNSNAFATAECRIFERLFEEWAKPGRWEKVMLRGFAIEPTTYFDNGGFDPRYNRFSDQVLAARLDEAGVELGYAADAKVKHFYNSHGGQFYHHETLRAVDEFRFRSENSEDFCRKYFGGAPDWDKRKRFDGKLARHAFCALMRSAFRPRRTGQIEPVSDETARELGRWALSGIFGVWPNLFVNKARILWLGLLSIYFRNDPDRLESLYLDAYHACARYNLYSYLRKHGSEEKNSGPNKNHWSINEISTQNLAGFHSIETSEGREFRWTGATGILLLKTPPTSFDLVVEFGNHRGNPRSFLVDIYCNSHRLPSITFDCESGEARATVEERWIDKRDIQEIILVVSPIPSSETGTSETRTLGAPVTGIRFEPDSSPLPRRPNRVTCAT